MSVSSNDFHGLWRASANEGVPYSEDFPEPFLVLPELIDGALGDGKASQIHLQLNIANPEKCKLVVEDNGTGIKSQKRMKDWTSKDTGNAVNEHEYGHGSKKCLTKWMPEYNTAEWKLYWRTQDKRGVSSVLHCLMSPFKGLETTHTEDDVNEDLCTGCGTRWEIEFKLSILGKYSTVKALLEALKELICIRYEPSYYDHAYTINVSITDGKVSLKESSTQWKSLKQTLEAEIPKGTVKKVFEFTITQNATTTVNCIRYKIDEDGRKFALPNFPQFGRKNINSTRVHIGRNGRYIEAMPYAKFTGGIGHNDDNGTFTFIMWKGDKLPTPCTTKVKLQEDCPVYITTLKEIKANIKKAEDEIAIAEKKRIAEIVAQQEAEKKRLAALLAQQKEAARTEDKIKRDQAEAARQLKAAEDKIKRDQAETARQLKAAEDKIKRDQAEADRLLREKEMNNRYEAALTDQTTLKALFDNYGRELLIRKLNELK